MVLKQEIAPFNLQNVKYFTKSNKEKEPKSNIIENNKTTKKSDIIGMRITVDTPTNLDRKDDW